MGASRPASHGRALADGAPVGPHALLRVLGCEILAARTEGVAAGSGSFSAWRRSGSWAWPACQAIGLLPAEVTLMGSSLTDRRSYSSCRQVVPPGPRNRPGSGHSLAVATQPIPRTGSHCSKPARRRSWPYADHFQVSCARACRGSLPPPRPPRLSRTRRRPRGLRPAPPRSGPPHPAPPRAARSRAAASLLAPRGRARPLGARPQRLGQRVLQRRRALDELELARLPLRLVRPQRAS